MQTAGVKIAVVGSCCDAEKLIIKEKTCVSSSDQRFPSLEITQSSEQRTRPVPHYTYIFVPHRRAYE